MTTSHLNLKFTMADMDLISRLAAAGLNARAISNFLMRRYSIPTTPDEISAVLKRNGIRVRR